MANLTVLLVALATASAGLGGLAAWGLEGPGGAGPQAAGGGAAGARVHLHEPGPAGDHAHDQVGMERPRFPPATGSVPSADDAARLEEVSGIRIAGDRAFVPSNGVLGGRGTLEDPFVLTGLHVTGDLHVVDTDACFVVKENYIDGQLSLNWNGPCVHVHHNYVRDLRVNENNERTGYATGGLLEANKIQFIGQLRHYDGELRDNVVGPFTRQDVFDDVLETTPLLAPQALVANVDGFNQGLIHHNTFYGSVDLDFHGHHHGAGFFAPHSHYHGDNATRMAGHVHDHTDRWTSVAFTDNLIVDEEGYGLRYEDQNHAGDDRTANSESTAELDDPHVHHTKVEILRNQVEGQLVVDVFNADDDLHHARNPGWLTVAGNEVVRREPQPGPLGAPLGPSFGPAPMVIRSAKEAQVEVVDNVLTYVPAPRSPVLAPLDGIGLGPVADAVEGPRGPSAGILVRDVRDANLTIARNAIHGADYGVWAAQMDAEVQWSVDGNTYDGVRKPVYYDESVANRPTGADI